MVAEAAAITYTVFCLICLVQIKIFRNSVCGLRFAKDPRSRYICRHTLFRGAAMAKPAIYVFAPDLKHPLGGMRMLYRHVDILNANGFQAYIVHTSPKFEIDWFEYSTPVLRGRVAMNPEDVAGFFGVGGGKKAAGGKGKRGGGFNQ